MMTRKGTTWRLPAELECSMCGRPIIRRLTWKHPNRSEGNGSAALCPVDCRPIIRKGATP